MPGLAFACAANSGGGGYRRSSRKIVSIAWWVSVATHYLRPPWHGRITARRYRDVSPEGPAHGQNRARRHPVDDAGRGRVPGDGRGEDAEPAAPVDDVRAVAVGDTEVADRKQDLRDLERQEDAEDGDAHAAAPHEHVGVEDREGDKEPGEGVRDVGPRQPGAELGRLGQDHEGAEREPEPAVRRERGGAEDVAVPELPHAGEELHHAAVEQRGAEPDHVRDERRVVPAQHERGERERGQAEWRRVGDRGRLEQRREPAFLRIGGHWALPSERGTGRRESCRL